MGTRFGMTMLALLGLSASAVSARAEESKIPLDQVPAAVMKAVKAKFPKAKIEEAEKEVKGGKTTYEITVEGADDHDVVVSLTADGTITEIEREIDVKSLPKAVTDAVKAKYPQGKLDDAEEVTDANGKVSYEVVVEQKGKKDRKLALDASGKITEDEESDED